MSDSHNALPTLDSYVVSCSCGWLGESHDSPVPAEQEAKRHEDNPRRPRTAGADPAGNRPAEGE